MEENLELCLRGRVLHLEIKVEKKFRACLGKLTALFMWDWQHLPIVTTTNEPATCTSILMHIVKQISVYSAWLKNVFVVPSCTIIQVVYRKIKTMIIWENCLPGYECRGLMFMDITHRNSVL